MGSVFGPIRFLLPVCRFCWFLYTLNIYAHFSLHFSHPLLMAEIWYLVTSQKTLPTIWCTYMKLVTKYQISAINSCWEKCDEKCAYMFNVYKFLSNCWWQKSDIWSQASYRYTILWVAFLDPSDSYFLFADLVGFYMCIKINKVGKQEVGIWWV
jgi:hypothetical protein